MEKEEGKELEEIREALVALVSRVDEIRGRKEKREDKNWKAVVNDFANGLSIIDGQRITIIIDISDSMIRNYKSQIELFMSELCKWRRRLICFDDEVEIFINRTWVKTTLQAMGVEGGGSDLLPVFKFLKANDLESPLVVFSDGILLPRLGSRSDADAQELQQILTEYKHPVLWIFPSRKDYERNKGLINPVIEQFQFKTAYMIEGEEIEQKQEETTKESTSFPGESHEEGMGWRYALQKYYETVPTHGERAYFSHVCEWLEEECGYKIIISEQ